MAEESMLKALEELATKKLAEIVTRNSSGERGWQGFDKAEVQSARALLDQGRAQLR